MTLIRGLLLLMSLSFASLAEIPSEAQQIILEQQGILKFGEINKIISLYKITDDTISHYFVQSGKDYMITKASDQIAGPELIVQGKKPTPIENLNKQAEKDGTTCSKYYIVSPDGALACKNAEDKFVAVDLGPKDLVDNLVKSWGLSDIDQLVQKKLPDFKDSWAAQKPVSREINTRENEDSDNIDNSTIDLTKAFEKRPNSKAISDIIINTISTGNAVKVAVGETSDVTKIEINYLQRSGETEAEIIKSQQKLCQVVTNCENNVISLDHIQTQKHLTFVEIRLVDDAKTILGNRSTIFAVDVKRTGKSDIAKYFEVVYTDDLSKNYYSPSYYYWIPHSSLVPNYNQFYFRGCNVGSASVAWAQVFAYFDRRAHYQGYSWGSQYLFRDNIFGTCGTPGAIAPSYLWDDNIHYYIIMMSLFLKTYCNYGVGETSVATMGDIVYFFSQNQLEGNPNWNWRTSENQGQYDASVASFARTQVAEGWPVVIVKWHGGDQQAVVVTGYRYNYYYYRRCIDWMCWWEEQHYYYWYLNYGWGGSNNGWYPSEAYYAVYVRY